MKNDSLKFKMTVLNVIPAKAGIQLQLLDSRIHGNDRVLSILYCSPFTLFHRYKFRQQISRIYV